MENNFSDIQHWSSPALSSGSRRVLQEGFKYENISWASRKWGQGFQEFTGDRGEGGEGTVKLSLQVSSQNDLETGSRRRCLWAQLCPTFCNPWTVTHQAPLTTGFPRQEYWSGLPFPSWGNLLDPGIEPTSPASPSLAGRFFIAEPPGKPYKGFADMLSPFPFIALILCEISLSASQQMMLQERKRLLLQETKRK